MGAAFIKNTVAYLPGVAAWTGSIIVAVFAVWRLSIFTNTAYQSGKLRIRKFALGLLMSSLTIMVLLFAIPYLANELVDLTTPRAKFWLQTIAGNWSPDSFPPFAQHASMSAESATAEPSPSGAETYEFSISAAVAFWLNNAIIFLLINLVWRSSKMAKDLDIAAALIMRDSFARSAAKALVRENFAPQEQEKILDVFREALEKGQSDLETHLPNIDSHGLELLKMMGLSRQQQDGPRPG